MTDAFIAIVVGGNPITGYKVAPQIIEHDGQPHPQITVGVVAGITPTPGDYVLILTNRNGINNLPVKRFFESSEANGRIVGVVKAPTGFVLTGNYKFIGNMIINGNTTMNGNLTVNGNVSINGNLTINGKPYLAHQHLAVTPGSGVSGGVSPV